MVLEIIQAKLLISQLNNLNINTLVQTMESPVEYVLIPSEGNVNHGDPQGLKLYLQAIKEIEKESDKL